jgi:phosphatidylglycerol:prolipoprotein diacylglycerol transferase
MRHDGHLGARIPAQTWSPAIPFPNIDPVFIDLGFFQIRWYALAYIFGLVLGWQYVQLLLRADRLWAEKDWRTFPRERAVWTVPLLGWRVPHAKLSFDKKVRRAHKVKKPATALQIDDLLLWAALGVIIGGRLGYIFLYALWYEHLRDFYLENPLRMIFVWQGGMSFHGGLLGVIVAVLVFAKVNKLDAIRVGDVIAPAVPIGLFFGRLANFINGELWGKVTTLPWGVIFPDPSAGPLPRHPSQLYEAGLEGIVLFLLLYFLTWHTRALHKRGLMVGVYLLGYAVARFLVEFVRETKDYIGSPDNWFTMGMLFSLPMALAGAAFIWFALRGPRAEPQTNKVKS